MVNFHQNYDRHPRSWVNHKNVLLSHMVHQTSKRHLRGGQLMHQYWLMNFLGFNLIYKTYFFSKQCQWTSLSNFINTTKSQSWCQGKCTRSIFHITLNFNSLRPRDAYMRHQACPSLVQIMACRLVGAKPLSEPMLPYCQLDHKEHNSVKF